MMGSCQWTRRSDLGEGVGLAIKDGGGTGIVLWVEYRVSGVVKECISYIILSLSCIAI